MGCVWIGLVFLVSESFQSCNKKGGLDSISRNTRGVREMCFQLRPGGYRTTGKERKKKKKKRLIYLVLSFNSAVNLD